MQQLKPVIAIVNSSSFGQVFPEHLASLNSWADVRQVSVSPQADCAELLQATQSAHGIIASIHPYYPAEFFSAMPQLCVLARHGIGFNNIAWQAAHKLGIPVTKVAGIVEQAAVAEHAVALMLSAARHIVAGDQAVRFGNWQSRAKFVGVELFNKKIAVIGLGNIGLRVAQIIKNGFNAQVLACDPNIDKSIILDNQLTPATLDQIWQDADIISLNCALTDTSRNLINEQVLSKIKTGVIIVNTARGELIDHSALLKALKSKKVRCYAADVVTNEPIDELHPLCHAENTIIVPHLGGYTYESLAGMGSTMVNNLHEVLIENKVPENLVDHSIPITQTRKWN